MPKCIYVGMFCVCVKLMKNEVVVVELWMISWLYVVVVVVLGCVVDELMHWVFIIVNCWWELFLLLKVWWSWLNCWIMIKWCFNFKFCVSLSAFLCIRPVNIFWDEFGHLKDQNLGFWVKRGWNPKLFNMTDERSFERALSEQASRFWIQVTWASPKRASSERAQKLLEAGRLSEQHLVQHFSVFHFVHLGTNPSFLKWFFWLV